MSSEAERIVARVERVHNVISEICSITGNAGTTIGILHEGQIIHQATFGYRDIESKIPADGDTIYHIGSLTKAIVAASFAILVDEGKIAWETPLHELIPEFHKDNEHISLAQLKSEANIIDLLNHRLGVTARNGYWLQKEQELTSDVKETANIVGQLQSVKGFRSTMKYCNWGYALTGVILEKLSGQSLDAFTTEHFFSPLGMKNTNMALPLSENHVSSYMALTDGTPFKVPPPPLTDGKVLAAAGAGKSTMNDLLIFYKSLLAASADQLETGKFRTEGSPFRRIAELWKTYAPITEGSTYGMGWVLTDLPGKGGLTGVNAYEADGLPVLCKDTPSRKMVYHNGAMNGAMSAVYLLPESQSAVVTLSNSFDLCDTPDWIAQLLVETLTDAPQSNDYVALAKKTSANALTHHPLTKKILEDERTPGTPVKPLPTYTGRYLNKIGNFFLDVTADGDGLRLRVQGLPKTYHTLKHYHYDVFFWECDRDDEIRMAMYPNWALGYHKVSFESNDGDNISHLNWAYDKAVPAGEVFFKQLDASVSPNKI